MAFLRASACQTAHIDLDVIGARSPERAIHRIITWSNAAQPVGKSRLVPHIDLSASDGRLAERLKALP
jgi:hypothetical protein